MVLSARKQDSMNTREQRAAEGHKAHAEARRRWLSGGRQITFTYRDSTGRWTKPMVMDTESNARLKAQHYHSAGYATKVRIA